jgi:dienelactone hydrolase
LVLQLEVDDAAVQRTIVESELRWQAFESAARKLIDAGLVDAERVAIAGFSRNGYYVEYALTHSSFPYAAAVAADNWDPSYVAQTLLDYANGGIDMHGEAPFGTALQAWIEKAPGFGADRVRTPLLKIEQSHALLGVLIKWEIFARLRYLKKPVEYYVVPNAHYGVHNTQNPAQVIALMERSADWFAFWLMGEEDSAPHKHAQYERWRVLRALDGTRSAEAVQSNARRSDTAQ